MLHTPLTLFVVCSATQRLKQILEMASCEVRVSPVIHSGRCGDSLHATAFVNDAI